MSRTRKGAYLWLQPARQEKGGKVRASNWTIRDGAKLTRTGCLKADIEGAELKLKEYIDAKHDPRGDNSKDPEQINVSDVLTIYAVDKGKKQARPKELLQRLARLLEFWGDKKLSDVKGSSCRAYETWRLTHQWKSSRPDQTGNVARIVSPVAARRELEDLRAAINYHRKEGLCDAIVEVTLPKKGEAKSDWLTRSEMAKFLRTVRALREEQGGRRTARRLGEHLARFVILGYYTGSRHQTILTASFTKGPGRSWVDLEHGLFYRKPEGKVKTKKEQPTITLDPPLLAHLRRWKEKGTVDGWVIEWEGKPGTLSFMTDVTKRHRAERDLQESEARFRSLTKLSSDWFWEQDAEFRFSRTEGRFGRRAS